jgi:RND family efflux transporter MFP subunit
MAASAAVVLLLAGQLGCQPAPAGGGGPQQGPPSVTIAAPIEREEPDFEEFTGRCEAAEYVQIRARVSGYLAKIAFKPGSFIEAGAPLFEIDPRPYQAARDQAAAAVTQAEARSARLKAEFDRAKKLLEQRALSREDYDKIAADYGEVTAAIAGAQANLRKAELDLGFTKVAAPIGGVVSREMITIGNLVSADQTMLTTIASFNPIYVEYDIDERIVLRIREMIKAGTFRSARENRVPIRMALEDSKGWPFEGFVNFVDNRIDPATGSMRIRGEFSNPKGENNYVAITPGMFARVRLQLGPPRKVLTIPPKAVMTDQDRKIVLAVNQANKVEAKVVRLGKVTDDNRQIVTEGLKAGDRVIVTGLLRARPGSEVKPQTEEETAKAVAAVTASGDKPATSGGKGPGDTKPGH